MAKRQNPYADALELFVHQSQVRDLESLVSVLEEPSDFHAIVLGMAYIDNMLEIFGSHVLRNAKAINLEAYGLKVAVFESIGALEPDTYEVLLALGTIRNRYAHRVSYTLEEKDYQRLNTHVKAWPVGSAIVPSLAEYIVDGAKVKHKHDLPSRSADVRACIWLLHYLYDKRIKEHINMHMFGTKTLDFLSSPKEITGGQSG